jgi:hypothetical protein
MPGAGVLDSRAIMTRIEAKTKGRTPICGGGHRAFDRESFMRDSRCCAQIVSQTVRRHPTQRHAYGYAASPRFFKANSLQSCRNGRIMLQTILYRMFSDAGRANPLLDATDPGLINSMFQARILRKRHFLLQKKEG